MTTALASTEHPTTTPLLAHSGGEEQRTRTLARELRRKLNYESCRTRAELLAVLETETASIRRDLETESGH